METLKGMLKDVASLLPEKEFTTKEVAWVTLASLLFGSIWAMWSVVYVVHRILK